MNIKRTVIYLASFLLLSLVVLHFSGSAFAADDPNCPSANYLQYPACSSIQTSELGFQIPTLSDILTFVIRVFFVIAGIAALFYMLIGAFAWVTSGGDKDAVTAAREKIQAAVIGMIMIVAVLAVIWTLEQVIFKRKICLGLSCPLTLPGLIKTDSTGFLCCTCVATDGSLCSAVDDTKGCTNPVINALDPTLSCK